MLKEGFEPYLGPASKELQPETRETYEEGGSREERIEVEAYVHMEIHNHITAYRFWTKVELRSPQDCWEWLAANDGRQGHGAFGVAPRKIDKAHRVAYELTYGEIPDGKVVRHICGNPPCVNPYHLRIGTQADNAIDRRAMGRDPVGESRSNSKLSNAQAKEIYARHYEHGESISAIARDFAEAGRVSEAAIYAIFDERSWRSVIDPSINDDAKAILEDEKRLVEWGTLFTPTPQGLLLSLSCGEQSCREPNHATFAIDEESYREAKHEREVERFWSKVAIRDEGCCWWWTGSKSEAGYGMFSYAKRRRPAHRIAWELHHEASIPDELLACHRCDHPACVNPHHIYLGTHKDNANDATERGRWNHKKGEDTASAKLTNDDVLSIVARYNTGESGRAIAFDYDIGFSSVHRIMSGETWAHLTGMRKDTTPDYTRRSWRTDFTDDEVISIRNRYRNGEEIHALAQKFRVTDKSMRSLVSGRTFGDVSNAAPLRERRVINGGKLSEADVMDIRLHAHAGVLLDKLAKRYGVTRSHISRIVAGKAWPRVGGPVVPTNGPAVGERAGMSKLTRTQVIGIRNQYGAGGVTQKDLASEHGVSESTVRKVTNRISWGHLPGKPVRTPKRISPALRGAGNPQAKLTASQAQEIYALAQSRKLADAEIARRYNVALSRVSDIRCGRSWASVTRHTDPPPGPLVGEDHPNSKLTNDQVREIYHQAHSDLKSQAQIAEDHGIHKSTVSQIKRGVIYRSITGHLPASEAHE